ncbi:MAG TPA: hypothetical protein PK008_06710 [Aminivibrio sp.]|uniref:hypothetical protein n=1 Tax=Aminivibrio sp. TaxID=1872489 RepID=UPI002B7595D3|nr:hypothetical protein [Aminivibrio sp.]HPF85098.1 hypothetical protein [Aminivibrio sp.]
MLRQRVRSFAAALCLLALIVLPAAGADVMDLYSGSSRAGQVASEKRGSGIMVSARDMAGVLGLETSEKGDTLIVTAGRSKLQLVAGAAAAWLDAELVPLAASTVQEGKEWLVESRSALKVFEGLLLRSGKPGNLRWEGTPHAGTPSSSPSSPVPSHRKPGFPPRSLPCQRGPLSLLSGGEATTTKYGPSWTTKVRTHPKSSRAPVQ